MSLTMSTTVSRVTRPNEKLFSGYGLSALATLAPAGYTGVGAAVLMAGSTLVEKYGLPTKVDIPLNLDDQLYFHFRLLRNNTTGECSATGWMSSGPVCDSNADPSLASKCLDYMTDNEFFSVQVKKRTGGTFVTALLDRAATPLGNYIKVFEEIVPSNQFTEMFNEPKTYYGPLFSENKILTTTIGLLRECDVYLKPLVDDNITVSWEGAYMPDVNEETLWLQDNKGSLLQEIKIYENQVDGSVNIPLEGGKEYKLVVPGYSYRNYSVTFERTLEWVIEPVKVHFFGSLGGEGRFYFKVLAGEAATFCMKDYNRGAIEGPYGATLTRITDDFAINLDTEIKQWFYQYDTVAIPVDGALDQVWRVDLKGKGRTAIWLDGIPNLFAESASTYWRPATVDNSITVSTPSFLTPLGKVPKFGHYMDYTTVPVDVRPLVLDLKGQTFNSYTFWQPMSTDPHFEDVFKTEFSSVFGAERDYTIFDAGTRENLFRFDLEPKCAIALDAWIDLMYTNRAYGIEHIISATDEANLSAPDYEWFRLNFIAFAEHIRANPKSVPANIKIAAPCSSRFDHGVTSEQNGRKGQDWATQIIAERPDLVDAVVWHDWTVHGLLNLRQYADTIEKAYALSNNGARRLCIEQTNTGGGSSVSLYQQNSQFITLWWAGIFAVATNTGHLDDLIYFLLADEVSHPKGLILTDENYTFFEPKIVAKFQGWLGEHLKGNGIGTAYKINNPQIELELCAFTNVKASVTRKFIMGVNKSKRSYTVNLNDFNWGTSGVECRVFNPDGTNGTISPTINVGAQTCVFTLPAETVFLLSQGVV